MNLVGVCLSVHPVLLITLRKLRDHMGTATLEYK